MTSITRDLRKDLEKAVKQARRAAEAGARQAVQQLRVGDGDAPKDLTADQRALRTQLRAHGRQLGDRRDAKTGAQETGRLVQECAYEHWHRMLFARFLAETDLLIEPDSGVAITLDEVQELAREKATDWLELASEYAERMLPQIFRKDDPVLQIALPPETRSAMEDLLKGLPKPIFEADDSLGWVYQFWQADRKQEINDAEVKIGADELPAVTQLFTEDYMVLFLLHNTLGAWWAGKVLATDASIATAAPDEDTVRAACRLADIDWKYLRFVREEDEQGVIGPWRPAAGVFDGWPRAAKDLAVLDPCMGSGHFLVFALPILIALRAAEEKLSLSAAVDAVLRENLYGLEIDPRCTQIAAFNLAFAAWRRVGHRPLPRLNLACSGLAIGVSKGEWLRLAEKVVTATDPAAKRDLLGVEVNLLTAGLETRVKNGLEALYDLFAMAPLLGSLIEPRRAGADIFREGYDKLEPLLGSILLTADTDEVREIAVTAQGMAKASEILNRTFTLIATNVPYRRRTDLESSLRDYLDHNYKNSSDNLAFAFLERLNALRQKGGTAACVALSTWLYLKSYTKLRHSLLSNNDWDLVADLGPGAFATVTGEVVDVALISLSRPALSQNQSRKFLGISVRISKSPEEKSESLVADFVTEFAQSSQITNPDCRIILEEFTDGELLSTEVSPYVGLQNGDTPRFVLMTWELPKIDEPWDFFHLTPTATLPIEGMNGILRWENGQGELTGAGARIQGLSAWGKRGIAVRQNYPFPCSIYLGTKFDQSCTVLIPETSERLPALWAYCSSNQFREDVRKIDKKRNVTTSTFAKVKLDLDKYSAPALAQYPDGLPPIESLNPTQWVFSGRPQSSEFALQVATCRLLGYLWPRQAGSSFMGSPAIELDALEHHADTEGVVCLTALKGEPPAEQRLNTLLASNFGGEWSAAKLASFLSEAGFAGRSLDDWLRHGFFEQHCELFHHRPFIWHIWDGRADGFHALVNYHRLAAPDGDGRRTLEKLIYSYLGDWIDRQRSEQKVGIEGADARLAHAEHLKGELTRILEGEPSYDIFTRWKPLHEQPVGWDPDINDGVRTNIRPFLHTTLVKGKKGDCILRVRPKGKEFEYGKDRGKEPIRDKADYPWFWSWDETTTDFAGGAEFDGNRWNDLHYSRAVKQAARDRHRASAGGKI